MEQMDACVSEFLKAHGLKCRSVKGCSLKNSGTITRMFTLEDRRSFWLTDACPKAGSPPLFTVGNEDFWLNSIQDLKDDLAHFLGNPKEEPSARETEIRAKLKAAVPAEFIARLVVTSVENTRGVNLKDGSSLLTCTIEGHTAYSLLAQEITRIVQDRLESYEARHGTTSRW